MVIWLLVVGWFCMYLLRHHTPRLPMHPCSMHLECRYELKGNVAQEGFYCFAQEQTLASLLTAAGAQELPDSLRTVELVPCGSSITVDTTLHLRGLATADRLNFFSPLSLAEATVEDLMLIPGIGEKTAEAIIAYRTQQGGIHDVHELVAVHGVGEKKLALLLPYLSP